MTKCNPLLRQKSEQDRLRVAYQRVEAQRLARSHALAIKRVAKALRPVLTAG